MIPQADAVRDTRTLSGGESFLVSLALALALSDLVSHKTRIDSLFLDEGFGTLDSETLDTAPMRSMRSTPLAKPLVSSATLKR